MAGAVEVASTIDCLLVWSQGSTIDCLLVWSQGTGIRPWEGLYFYGRVRSLCLQGYALDCSAQKGAVDAAVTPTLKLRQASCGCRRVAMVGRRTC
jgi:hypothetical protein